MLSDKAAIKLQVLTNLCNGPHVKVDQAVHCRVTILRASVQNDAPSFASSRRTDGVRNARHLAPPPHPRAAAVDCA